MSDGEDQALLAAFDALAACLARAAGCRLAESNRPTGRQWRFRPEPAFGGALSGDHHCRCRVVARIETTGSRRVRFGRQEPHQVGRRDRSTLEMDAEMTEGTPRKPDAVHPGWLPGDNPRPFRLIVLSADLGERYRGFVIRAIAVFTLLIGIVPCQARLTMQSNSAVGSIQ
jgi:hypothetical protein